MITLTEQAAFKVKEMLQETENPGNQYLRVGVQHGGCSGFSYLMGFDEDKATNDLELEQHGVRVLIDDESQRLMKGTIVDYKESLMGGGFQIENPNASITCGCGSSFRTAVDEGEPDKDC